MLSLVVATCNRHVELNRFLASIADCNFNELEIIIVDQNDKIDLSGMIQNYQKKGIDITHIKTSIRNLSLARNLGIARSKFGIIGFPDDDCYYSMDTIKNIVNHFSVMYSDVLVAKWAELDYSGVSGLRILDNRDIYNFRTVPFPSITLFVRRFVLDRVGYFDGEFGVGQIYGSAEETDLIMRISKAGFQICFDETVVVHHFFDTERRNIGALSNFKREIGTGAVYVKNCVPKRVVFRGIFGPLLKCLLRKDNLGFNYHLSTSMGRIVGFIEFSRRRR